MVASDSVDGIEVISFNTDRINALNIDSIRPVIMKAFEAPYSKVIIDLEGVNYLDSTAFAMFLHLLRIARSNYSSYKLCSLTPGAGELFELLQLHQSIDILNDRESCFESFRSGPPY